MGILIAGFSPSDKVPGAYGEVKYGAGGTSAGSIPLLCLLVGLALSSGTLAPNGAPQLVTEDSDADLLAGAGSELAAMAYDAVDAAPGVPIWIASPAPAGGAVAATDTILVSGTWTVGGTYFVRIAGVTYPVSIGPTDSTGTVATNIAAAISSDPHCPASATASASTVVLAWKTPGVRGNQAIVFQDTSQTPSGFGASLTGATWANQAWTTAQYAVPTVANGYYYKCTTGGTGNPTQPTWPTTVGTTVTEASGGVVWTCWGQIVTGGGVQLGGGSGLETYTNLLNAIFAMRYDRIAVAANDATSLAAISAQITSQASVMNGILQHAVTALNGTLTAASSVASSTLNSQRFQVLWELNSETHPSRLAAQMAATRTNAESDYPNKSYDGQQLVGAAPQTQPADRPLHATKVTALSTGVTPLSTDPDGTVRVVRSITSHCLSGSNPDYSTLDTGQATTPDFILTDLKLYWATVFVPGNLVLAPDPPAASKQVPAGVGTPGVWNAMVLAKDRDYEAGTNFPAPLIIDVDDNLPNSEWDDVGRKIITANPIEVAPGDHQVLISVRQS